MKSLMRLWALSLIAIYVSTCALPLVALAQSSNPLTATPTSGMAPLAVTFTSPYGFPQSATSSSWILDYGDNLSSPPIICNLNVQSGEGLCITPVTLRHTYTTPGIYTAWLKIISNISGQATTTLVSSKRIVVSVPTCKLHLNSTLINPGGSVTLSWTSTNATGGAITNVGNVAPSGSVNLLPSSAAYTTYIGSFTGPAGTANCSVTLQVGYGTGSGTGAAGGTSGTPAPQSGGGITPTPSAPASGLVPCGYGAFSTSNGTASATGCQACDLASLIQSIINFLIGLSIPIAAVLFAYAGFLYMISGADHHNIDKAKGIFKNAFIGFMIVITAWLVINTVLHVIFSQGRFANSSWFTIECSDNALRPVAINIGDVLKNVISGASIPIGGGVDTSANGGTGFSNSGSNGVCPPGYAYLPDADQCSNADGTSIVDPTFQSSGAGGSCPSGYVYLPDANQCSNADGSSIIDPTPVSGGSGGSAGNCPAGYKYDDTSGDAPTCYNSTTDMAQDPIPNGQQCPTGSTYYAGSASAGTASTCYNATTDEISEPITGTGGGITGGNRGVAQCSSDNTACSVSALQEAGLTSTQANVMSCIAVTESSGNPSVGCSSTFTSCGTFQINNGNWQTYAPSNCSAAAFGGSLAAAKANAACNLQVAAILVQTNGYQPWSGTCNVSSGCGEVAYGQKWNPAASTCVNNYGSQ